MPSKLDPYCVFNRDILSIGKSLKKDERIKVSKKSFKYWWHTINAACFNEELNFPKVEIRHIKGYWAVCIPSQALSSNKCEIHLSPELTNKKLFIETVAHEMVHVWQCQKYGHRHPEHGKSFIKWKKFFKRNFNLDL